MRVALHELRHVRAPAHVRICFVCQHHEVEWVELPGTGHDLHVHRRPPRAVARSSRTVVPYVSAVIELDGTQGAGRPHDREHRRLRSRNACAIGDRVRIAWDRVSDTLALPRFAPE